MVELPRIDVTGNKPRIYNTIGGDYNSVFYKLPKGLVGRRYFKPIEDFVDYELIIRKMVDKQKDVKLSYLPQGLLVSNDFIVGFYMKLIKKRIDLQKLASLKEESQKAVLHNLVSQVSELVTNGIYPFSISAYPNQYNSPELIISRTGETQILKLDGYSVEVMEEMNPTLERFTFTQLSSIISRKIWPRLNFEGKEEDLEIINFLNSATLDLSKSNQLHEVIDYAYSKK